MLVEIKVSSMAMLTFSSVRTDGVVHVAASRAVQLHRFLLRLVKNPHLRRREQGEGHETPIKISRTHTRAHTRTRARKSVLTTKQQFHTVPTDSGRFRRIQVNLEGFFRLEPLTASS